MKGLSEEQKKKASQGQGQVGQEGDYWCQVGTGKWDMGEGGKRCSPGDGDGRQKSKKGQTSALSSDVGKQLVRQTGGQKGGRHVRG